MRPLPIVDAASAPEEPLLLGHGWTRRFVGDARMAEEATALYSRLGFEVMAVPLDTAEVAEPCAGCAATLGSFSVLYTRRIEDDLAPGTFNSVLKQAGLKR